MSTSLDDNWQISVFFLCTEYTYLWVQFGPVGVWAAPGQTKTTSFFITQYTITPVIYNGSPLTNVWVADSGVVKIFRKLLTWAEPELKRLFSSILRIAYRKSFTAN